MILTFPCFIFLVPKQFFSCWNWPTFKITANVNVYESTFSRIFSSWPMDIILNGSFYSNETKFVISFQLFYSQQFSADNRIVLDDLEDCAALKTVVHLIKVHGGIFFSLSLTEGLRFSLRPANYNSHQSLHAVCNYSTFYDKGSCTSWRKGRNFNWRPLSDRSKSVWEFRYVFGTLRRKGYRSFYLYRRNLVGPHVKCWGRHTYHG